MLLNFRIFKSKSTLDVQGVLEMEIMGTAIILALSASNLAVQFELRFQCRGTKLNPGDGYASQFTLSYVYNLFFDRHIDQSFVCSSFTLAGSGNQCASILDL